MCRSAAILLFLIAALPRAAVSQQGAPLVSLTAGVGHSFGGVGLHGELLLADSRFGIIGGAGILPGLHYLRSPITGAVGLRYYFARHEHRFYANASWSLLHSYDILMLGVPTFYEYGPGLSLGYSFLSKIGFTFTVGAGVGRTGHETLPIGEVGLGWTWRRSS